MSKYMKIGMLLGVAVGILFFTVLVIITGLRTAEAEEVSYTSDCPEYAPVAERAEICREKGGEYSYDYDYFEFNNRWHTSERCVLIDREITL